MRSVASPIDFPCRGTQQQQQQQQQGLSTPPAAGDDLADHHQISARRRNPTTTRTAPNKHAGDWKEAPNATSSSVTSALFPFTDFSATQQQRPKSVGGSGESLPIGQEGSRRGSEGTGRRGRTVRGRGCAATRRTLNNGYTDNQKEASPAGSGGAPLAIASSSLRAGDGPIPSTPPPPASVASVDLTTADGIEDYICRSAAASNSTCNNAPNTATAATTVSSASSTATPPSPKSYLWELMKGLIYSDAYQINGEATDLRNKLLLVNDGSRAIVTAEIAAFVRMQRRMGAASLQQQQGHGGGIGGSRLLDHSSSPSSSSYSSCGSSPYCVEHVFGLCSSSWTCGQRHVCLLCGDGLRQASTSSAAARGRGGGGRGHRQQQNASNSHSWADCPYHRAIEREKKALGLSNDRIEELVNICRAEKPTSKHKGKAVYVSVEQRATELKKLLEHYPSALQSFILLSCRCRKGKAAALREELLASGTVTDRSLFEKHPRLPDIIFFRRGRAVSGNETEYCERFNCSSSCPSSSVCGRAHACLWCREDGHGFLECPNHVLMTVQREACGVTDDLMDEMLAMLTDKFGSNLGFTVVL